MATWPLTIPDFNLPLTDEHQDTTLRTNMDAGPQKVRRRYTAGSRFYSVPIRMDGTQYETLLNFYNNNISFEMVDPLSGTTNTFRFRTPPSGRVITGGPSPANRIWDVNLNLEKLP